VPGAVGIRPSQAALRVSAQGVLPDDCQDMRAKPKLNAASASTIRWSFVKAFKTTEECLAHLEKNGFGSVVTSPYMKGCTNGVLHEADCTTYTKLAVWFGNEGAGISPLAIERSEVCSNIPMYGIIEGLTMDTSSGIVLYKIGKQRRVFQARLSARTSANTRAAGEATPPDAPDSRRCPAGWIIRRSRAVDRGRSAAQPRRAVAVCINIVNT